MGLCRLFKVHVCRQSSQICSTKIRLKYHFCHSYAIDFEHSEESEQRSVVDFKLSWASVFGANVQVMGHLSSLSKCLGAFVLGQISLGQMSLNQHSMPTIYKKIPWSMSLPSWQQVSMSSETVPDMTNPSSEADTSLTMHYTQFDL